ncbi:serine-rich adhesin for platelets-like isoform X4 [Periplaneta americana]|uniref:serine-rich adhesin for platelets-like isoform X4 n=1 Tax=Periplaneta americana TaxID=6978 RepID=UPI0037E8E9CE
MKVVDLLCFRRHVKRRRRRRLWNVWTCLQVPRRQRTMTHKKLSFTALEQSSIWRFRRAGRSDAMAPTPPLPVTEDTPPDMLAGSMDLRVVLPSGQSVKMSVERSTPMMDLLVQVTTVNKISTGGHVLQAIGERGILPYKPSTPIGALDAWTIQVVAKSKVQTNTVQKKAPLKPLNQQQPFEQTFRLQVHLPRNQLYVMRVSPRTLLSDILNQTCAEKNLDPNKYEMRHPANLSQLLSPSCTLADYRLQEVTVVARSRAPGLGSALSSSDIMALQREEDKRRQQARQQHGTGTGLGLVFNKRSQSSVCEGSVSSDSLGGRSISPARSDESASRSASPPAPNLPPMIAPLPPARPARKRRPAPKPPSLTNGPSNNKQQSESNMQAESSTGTVVNGHSENNSKTTNVPVSHSRNSSDSSGYHEASVLSESPADGHQMSDNCSADTLPRRGKLTSGQPTRNKTQNNNHGLSRSMSSLTGVGGSMASCQHSTSNTSLASSTGQGQKKKKAPPPPPGAAAAAATKDRQQQNNMSSLSLSSTEQDVVEHHNKTTSLERHLSGKTSTTVSNQLPDKCSTLPGKMKMSGHDYKSSSSQEDEDYRIPEVEENSSLTNMHKEPSSLSKQTKEEVHNGPSPEIAIEKQDTPSQELAMSPVETTPEAPVELVPSPKAAAKSIPEETEEIGIAEAVDQVEEAFRSVTAELEAASEQDEDVNVLIPPPVTAIDEVEKLNSLPSEDLNILPPPPLSATKQDENIEAIPPPPSSAEDMAVDWEYQLPAPPSAFRDSNSPTFTEGGTVMLADTQVFQEPSLSPEPQPQNDPMVMHLSRAVHRNEVTRTNPLFDPRQCEEDPKQSTGVCEVGMEEFSNETKSLESRDTSNRKGGDLANFTITAYQRPRETDEIFNEDSDDDRTRSALNSVKKPITTQTHRYGSSNSLNNNAVHNTAANLSRTNSFNNNNNITFKPPAPVATSVKRSTSYISLIANTTSQPGKSLQSGPVYTSRTKSVGNLAVEEQGDRNVERTHENWGLRKTSSEFNVSQDTPAERQEEFETPQTKAEEPRGSQQGIVITAEERARLLALQEQFLQLQEQLLQNSSLLQQQQQQPHASQTPNADTPLQSLQVLRSILPQLHQTKAPSQQQSSESSVPLRSDTLPAKASKHSENSSGDQLIKQTTVVTLNQQNNNEKPSNDESTGEQKRYKYQGPPAINFATWSERPKSQVSIKMDGDYRIGIGQGGRTDEHNETPARTGMSETKDRTSAAGRKQDIEVSSKSNNSHEEATDQNKFQVSGGKLNSTEPITKVEPASLTMRLISHTTASGFRKPIGVANQKFGSSNYVTAETQHSETKEVAGSSTVGVRVGSTSQHNDPSRVPIVRAVELKKSFIQQQSMYNNSNSNSNNNNSNSHNFRGSSTMLNGERSGGSSVAESDGDNTVETFVGVNSLTKRFSVVSSSSNNAPNFRSSRPVSAYGKVENLEVRGRDAASSLPYNNSLSYRSTSSTNLNTTTNVNTYQDVPLKNGGGRSTRRYTSVVGITNDSDHNLSSSSFREPASESSRVQSRVSGSSVVRVNGFTAPKQLMPVVKGFQFACPAANRDPSPPPSKTSNTTNNFHPKVHRSESTSAVRSWKTVDTTDQSSTSFNNVKAYLRRNSNEPKPEPIATKTATPNTESQPPAPPPLAASLRKSTARPRPKTLPAPQLNPRDQLMDAIRNFGGRENLKQVRDNRESSLNIVLIR